jgi:hypothetical protein
MEKGILGKKFIKTLVLPVGVCILGAILDSEYKVSKYGIREK